MRILFLIVMMICGSSKAAEVLKASNSKGVFAVTHHDLRAWKMNEEVCIFRGKEQLGCGRVFKIGKNGAAVRMNGVVEEVETGDQVYAKKERPRKDRKTASGTSNEEVRTSNKNNNIAAGIYSSFGFFFPQIHFNHAFTENLALGIMPIYMKATGTGISVTGFGGYVTGLYYPNGFMKGLYGQLGLGAYTLSYEQTALAIKESATPLSLNGLVGWRAASKNGLNVGVAVGIHFMSEPFSNLELKSAGVKPLALLEFGYSF